MGLIRSRSVLFVSFQGWICSCLKFYAHRWEDNFFQNKKDDCSGLRWSHDFESTKPNVVHPLWRTESSCVTVRARRLGWSPISFPINRPIASATMQCLFLQLADWVTSADRLLYCHHLLLLIQPRSWLNFPLLSVSSSTHLLFFQSCSHPVHILSPSPSLMVNYRADKGRAHVLPRNHS